MAFRTHPQLRRRHRRVVTYNRRPRCRGHCFVLPANRRHYWFGSKVSTGVGQVRLKHREVFFGSDVKKASVETV